MINWAEVFAGVVIGAVVSLLLDEIVLRGKARKVVIVVIKETKPGQKIACAAIRLKEHGRHIIANFLHKE